MAGGTLPSQGALDDHSNAGIMFAAASGWHCYFATMASVEAISCRF